MPGTESRSPRAVLPYPIGNHHARRRARCRRTDISVRRCDRFHEATRNTEDTKPLGFSRLGAACGEVREDVGHRRFDARESRFDVAQRTEGARLGKPAILMFERKARGRLVQDDVDLSE